MWLSIAMPDGLHARLCHELLVSNYADRHSYEMRQNGYMFAVM